MAKPRLSNCTCVFSSPIPADHWSTAHAHQYAIEAFMTIFAGTFEGNFDLIVDFGHRANFGVQEDSILEQLGQLAFAAV